MSRRPFVNLSLLTLALAALTLLLGCANNSAPVPKRSAQVSPSGSTPRVAAPSSPVTAPSTNPLTLPPTQPVASRVYPIMLGIDVLEADGFRAIAGKKIGLLTHPAGVNRRGEPTWAVLRRAPQSRLLALFAPEHGFDGQIKAGDNFGDTRHTTTGLPVYSLHGANRKPTKAQLKGLDALVIDLQDIGVRSYTFSVVMRYAMDACFEHGVEVIVLDRPNPLGGFKVDGPPLDPDLLSGVGAFPRMPYVHGLTIGEIARMSKFSTNVTSGMDVTEKVRANGKLTVIPMRGWTRNMLWSDTGLRWIATSPNIPDFDSAIGYAMVGLGTQNSGWTFTREFRFRAIAFPKKNPDEIIKAMESYRIPGIAFTKRVVPSTNGKTATQVYVEITNWQTWNPTELSFYMHKQAAIWTINPFAALKTDEIRQFKIHVGSHAWFNALRRDGARIDVPIFVNNWNARAKAYQAQTKRYWIYQ